MENINNIGLCEEWDNYHKQGNSPDSETMDKWFRSRIKDKLNLNCSDFEFGEDEGSIWLEVQ